jgi:hypothetical protein
VNGFPDNVQNRNVVIENNQIDESYDYAIFVANADGVQIVGNTIGRTFIRGAFDAGGLSGIVPGSAIYLGRSKDVVIGGNTAARGPVAKAVVAVDKTCDRGSVRIGDNRLT